MAEFPETLKDKNGIPWLPHPKAWTTGRLLSWLKEKPPLVDKDCDLPFMK